MPIVKITGQGISAIALSVALLWACLISTHITMHRAMQERARIFRELDRLQRRPKAEPDPFRLVSPRRTSPAPLAG